ncbi:MAG TPA: GDSL-type esterase/lipase family protein [Solirubrobacteraceae bacterium]|nr:GDSL-type esterase/lipase family protein [Solirubrobacteraceae bacterium]
MSACRLGVIAFGDSITNGGGELQWGVALQSWALWVARGLGLPYTPHAQDGATVQDVLATQIPRARKDTRYDLGCLYVGANDVRLPSWDRAAFERDLRTALAFLAERCDRVLTATVPLDLGRPRAGAAVLEANDAIEASADATQALVLDLRDFGARNLMMPDHVHPTAFGQIAIAERALDLLAAHGLEPRSRPSSLISYDTTRRGRLRGDLTYAYRHAKISARVALSAAASARRRRRPAA